MSDRAAWILVVGIFLIVVFFRLSSPYEQCVIAQGYTKEATRSCSHVTLDASVDASVRNGDDPFSGF
jgi:hypothetical protein